jgi:RNA polymerase sigma factor (sigma-70 family)
MPLNAQIETLFRDAEPRLLRLARSHQIAPDAAEDIVQETLLEAWKALDHLRDDALFAAWLDGICRNVCRRHQHKQGILQAREQAWDITMDATDTPLDWADPNVFDPAEELSRQDMAFLLDRALGFLAPESRLVMEQHYLADVPQRELAAQLGLTLSALEARLHRARTHLARVLSHDLRAEALALGLAVTPEDAVGWRATSLWCIFCGQQRMQGIFEPMPDGRVNVRLRCVNCPSSEISTAIEINSLGLGNLAQARSFLPAVKKLVDEATRFYLAALANGGRCQCWVCHQPTHLRVTQDATRTAQTGIRTWLDADCQCIYAPAITIFCALPQVKDYLLGTERVLVGPEACVAFEGHPSIRFSLLNLATGRSAYIFADARTLLPLGVAVE